MRTLTRLRESLDSFSETERRIARYILDCGGDLSDVAISDVARACGASKSMVVQLCKKAGYKGYKDLRGVLRVERALAAQSATPDFGDIHPGCSVAQICSMTMWEEIRSLQDTFALFDEANMTRAVDALLEAARVELFGVGNSGVVAQDMHNKLRRIGMNTCFTPDAHGQRMDAATLGEGDCAVVFSYSGQTRDMLDAARTLQKQGAKLVSVTRQGGNALSALSDVALYVASGETLVRTGAMASRLAMLTMVDMLFSCVASRRHDDILGLLERTAVVARALREPTK